MDLLQKRALVDVAMLQMPTPSFCLTISNRDRVIYVFAKIGFYMKSPCVYFDIRNRIVVDRKKDSKKPVDDVALREAVYEQGIEIFDSFYIVTEEPFDYFVTKPSKGEGISEKLKPMCLPLEKEIIALEDFFEYDESLYS